MKLSKKSIGKKKYQNGDKVTPALPKSGPELTYPADVTYGEENLTGAFPTGQSLDDLVPFTRMMNSPGFSNPSQMFRTPAPFGNYTTQNQPQGTISTQDSSFAPGVFSDKQAQSIFTPMMSPININDVDLNTPGIQQGPLTQGEASARGAQGQQILPVDNNQKRRLDNNSMFTLGLAGVSTLLNQNQEQINRRELNESIQQRRSQPQYDYNYMYGRTTSGGTEYQPIVKAEMGAQINKRYDSPNSLNNVEIEGGEYLQLPDMSAEMAYGPSHSRGGIETSLPEGTKVYSNHLKPMGSKKTFAQIAKKYDNTEYDKTLGNKFAKQVDKDTAAIMRDKNQKVLDKLFMEQQLLNGNSNGQPMGMAKNGASINNAGFRALPQAVQEKILSNMEYGGYNLPKLQGGDWYTSGQWDAGMQQSAQSAQPQQGNWYNESQWDAGMQNQPRTPGTPLPDLSNMFPRVMTNNVTQPVRNGVINPFANSTPSSYSGMGTAPLPNFGNMPSQQAAAQFNPFDQSNQPAPQQRQQTQQATTQPQTTSKKTQQSNIPNNLSENGKAIPTYTEDDIERIRKYDPNFNPTLGTVPGMQRTVDGVYGSTKNIDLFNQNYDWYLPKFKEQYGRDLNPRSKEDMGIAQKAFQEEAVKRFIDLGYTPEDAQTEAANIGFTTEKGLPNSFDEMLGFYTATRKLPNAKPKDKTPATTDSSETTETTETVNAPGFTSVTGDKGSGKYYRQPFPLYQAIPNVMGLAASQETFPYAIPEIDSPYIRPQTLNIQSQLQDIDNMGQASVRAGADPLSAYIAGIGGKEKAFQSKQNFDAQGRMQADMFNAQSQQRADMMNAQMFDRTYNQLIAQARDAATAEQQAAISNLIEKKAKYDQDENLKSLYLDNLQSAFEIGKDRPYSMTVDPQGKTVISYGVLPPEIDSKAKGKVTKTKEDETKTTDVIPPERVTRTINRNTNRRTR